MFLGPSPSVSTSQLLSCVWVPLSLSLPYPHLSELPPGPVETPEFRAPTKTVTKEFEPRERLLLNPGVHLMVGHRGECPVLDTTP